MGLFKNYILIVISLFHKENEGLKQKDLMIKGSIEARNSFERLYRRFLCSTMKESTEEFIYK